MQVQASLNCTWQEDPGHWTFTQEGREVHSLAVEEMRISIQVKLGCFRDEAHADRYAHGTADFPYTLDEVLDILSADLCERGLMDPGNPLPRSPTEREGARARPQI